MTFNVDVLIVGGGPAGAAVGLALAQSGRSTAVLTRERVNRPHIGETVSPAIIQPLVRLDLWKGFLADGHAPAPGTMVCWGDDQPYEYEFILNPYGDGWHLDRARFDTMLIEGARAAGVKIEDMLPGSRIDHDSAGWCVRLGGGSPRVLRAPFLVDATGRGASICTRQGIPRYRDDRLIALVRFGKALTAEPRTLIEACAEGWWYGAVLPQDRAVIAFFTDPDLVPVGKLQREAFWVGTLSRTRLARQMVVSTKMSRIYAAPANSSELSTCAGRQWLAVGDAARTLDPLSGQGLYSALESAIRAAEVILGGCSDSGLKAYTSEGAEEYRRHISARLDHYLREDRWPDMPFWHRRHSKPQRINNVRSPLWRDVSSFRIQSPG
jgi:flavin-dependent dehydrogenase